MKLIKGGKYKPSEVTDCQYMKGDKTLSLMVKLPPIPKFFIIDGKKVSFKDISPETLGIIMHYYFLSVIKAKEACMPKKNNGPKIA